MSQILQRPLTGEPLSLDLVNTWWIDGGTPQDLLAIVEGTRAWLVGVGLADDTVPSEIMSQHLRETRALLRTLLEEPQATSAREQLNVVLAKGTLTEQLADAGPERRLEIVPEWRVPWLCAQNYLDLLRTTPDRIRQCDEGKCVLYFLDTTKNGIRRWCSSKTCGNRAKRRRYYRRTLK